MLKNNDLLQVVQNPGMLSEEPTIPQELFDDDDNPNTGNKFYTKINEPFEVVNDIKYLYHVQCYVN